MWQNCALKSQVRSAKPEKAGRRASSQKAETKGERKEKRIHFRQLQTPAPKLCLTALKGKSFLRKSATRSMLVRGWLVSKKFVSLESDCSRRCNLETAVTVDALTKSNTLSLKSHVLYQQEVLGALEFYQVTTPTSWITADSSGTSVVSPVCHLFSRPSAPVSHFSTQRTLGSDFF